MGEAQNRQVEAGIPQTCGPCKEKQLASPFTLKEIRPVASHITKTQCDIEWEAGVVPPLGWGYQACGELPPEVQSYFNRCMMPERPDSVGLELYSLLSLNIFDRELQFHLRNSPLNPNDEAEFQKFLSLWRERVKLIPTPSTRAKLERALTNAAEQWKELRDLDTELAGSSGVDMAMVRAQIAATLVQSVNSPEYISNLRKSGVNQARAEEMQTEEIDALYTEYPEFKDRDVNALGPFSFMPFSPRDRSIGDSALRGLPDGASKEDIAVCGNLPGSKRFDRQLCRTRAAAGSILEGMMAEKKKGFLSPANQRRQWWSRESKYGVNELEKALEEARKVPALLVNQPELWAQLSEIRNEEGNERGRVNAFVQRCAAEDRMIQSLQSEANANWWVDKAGTAAMVVGMVLSGRAGRTSATAKATNNIPMLRDARTTQSVATAVNAAGLLAFAGTTTHHLVKNLANRKRESMAYILENSRSPEGVSDNYVRMRAAEDRVKGDVVNLAILAVAASPAVMTARYEAKVASAATASEALTAARIASRYRKVNVTIMGGAATAAALNGQWVMSGLILAGIPRYNMPSQLTVVEKTMEGIVPAANEGPSSKILLRLPVIVER